uniref:Venom peptide 3 n=1 Tax=Orancistrocerus drewseni TaxID=529024 RepID=VP3_ORADR|nr:RecName: Full=Venom peptide 3; Short=OdVP3; Short=VP3; Flags: Precursor [Orancistrocerus drewseni]ACU30740.1 venom peptide 3 precursor [Orancistrocerus drewseni]
MTKQSIVIVLFAAIAMMACLQRVTAEPAPEPIAAPIAEPYANPEAIASPEAKDLHTVVSAILQALGKK